MDMTAVIQKMLSLFLLLVLGYFCNRVKLMDAPFCSRLSKLVANVSMPAIVLYSAMGEELAFSDRELLHLIAVSMAFFVFLALSALIFPYVWKPETRDMGTYRFMTMFPNAAFMGYPVVAAVFGSGAVLYAAVLNLPFNLAVFSIGPLLLSGGRDGKRLDPRALLNPGIFAAVAALAIILTGFRAPAVLEDITGMLGNSTTPLAMLIIGSNLADMPLKKVFGSPRMYVFSAFRLILSPVLLWLILRPFVTDPMALGTAVVLAGMPTATNASILSAQYGGNEELAAQGVMITTLLSVLTIPAVQYVLFR